MLQNAQENCQHRDGLNNDNVEKQTLTVRK